MILTFGKHKGEDTVDVPLSYIKWLEEQDWISEALRTECQYQIERQEGNVSSLGKRIR